MGILESGWFWKRIFCSPFSLPFTRKRRFRAPETQVSQNAPPGRRFKNTGFSSMCGRTKQAFFHVMHHILLVLRTRCKGCYRISLVLVFSCGRAYTNQTRSDLSLIHVVRDIERFTCVANIGTTTKKRFQKNRPQPRQDCLGTPSWL